jgi:PilZ domain
MQLNRLDSSFFNKDERRAQRADVNARVTVRERGSSKFAVDLIDISVTGFRFKTLYTVKIQTRIWITLPGLVGLEAEIAWHRDPLYGAFFVYSLHPAVRDHIARLYPN